MLTWNFAGPARVSVEECSYLLARDLDTVVVLFVACINNRACTLVMYNKLYMQDAKCKPANQRRCSHIL